jgi:hypothetical protein
MMTAELTCIIDLGQANQHQDEVDRLTDKTMGKEGNKSRVIGTFYFEEIKSISPNTPSKPYLFSSFSHSMKVLTSLS